MHIIAGIERVGFYSSVIDKVEHQFPGFRQNEASKMTSGSVDFLLFTFQERRVKYHSKMLPSGITE